MHAPNMGVGALDARAQSCMRQKTCTRSLGCPRWRAHWRASGMRASGFGRKGHARACTGMGAPEMPLTRVGYMRIGARAWTRVDCHACTLGGCLYIFFQPKIFAKDFG